MSRFAILSLTVSLLAASMACGGSSPTSPSPDPSSSGTPVSIVAGSSTLTTNAYSPNPIAVSVGTTVTWTNNDAVAHTSTADGGAFSSGTIPAGGRFSHTFTSPGTFPYHCAIHPNMVGTVTVQ